MKKIEDMNYVEFISLIRETNRCPGGKDTIHWILRNSFANSNSKVLEVGSNTGFSSLEVARTLKCSVLGIDPVKDAVKTARAELQHDSEVIKQLVKFEVGSAYDIPCKGNSIDLIIAGGSTSFMDDKEKAIKEMERVLMPWGILSVTNLYYHSNPPKELLKKVSEVIGVSIQPMTSNDWVQKYLSTGKFELYKYDTVQLKARSAEEIEEYIEYFMNKPHIQELSKEERDSIRKRWLNILEIFNENHRYLGFIRALLRKRTIEEEPELFKVD